MTPDGADPRMLVWQDQNEAFHFFANPETADAETLRENYRAALDTLVNAWQTVTDLTNKLEAQRQGKA